jgi:hypothetical protein
MYPPKANGAIVTRPEDQAVHEYRKKPWGGIDG